MRTNKMTLYVVHHSHTDIGYTDLQEKIILTHIAYIRSAVAALTEAGKKNSSIEHFKWNCETYFCVEQFLKEANEEEKNAFFELVRTGHIGISANYLNFTDIVDMQVLNKRIAEMVKLFADQGVTVNAAMNADVNGVPLGMLDVFINNGIQFFYTNIHCHHGMYPLYQNQKPYFWENTAGKRVLVWNGEHYNLGNVLGIAYNKECDVMPADYEKQNGMEVPLKTLKEKATAYITECLEGGYPYDFIPVSVSGVFSDNAPPHPFIAELLQEFNTRYGDEITFEMVTVSQLYEKIKDKTADAPVYRGDLTDWWAHGIGSVPNAVKHYKEAQRVHALCCKLDPQHAVLNHEFTRQAENNMLLFAEHTFGHSATATDPYETLVQHLDIRKISYASNAFEAAEKNLVRLLHQKGDTLVYYGRKGRMRAINPASSVTTAPVHFYIAAYMVENVSVIEEKTEKPMEIQISRHPRGALVSFVDRFAAGEEKTYRYEQIPVVPQSVSTRCAFIGAERIRDIVNDYDTVSYTLPYGIESDFFRISYEIGKGITSFYDKKAGRELLVAGDARFFTPVYENTEIRTDIYEERRLLGRNIRACHTKKYIAELSDIKVLERGAVFTAIELVYSLEGTLFSSVVIRLYHHLPRIDFKYKIAKSMSYAIENILLPLTLNTAGNAVYFDKGSVPFMPGVEQIPGTCMEYYVSDTGVVYHGKGESILIQQLDTALLYMGELKHHPITLCDNKPENNCRNVYSWIMNNIWETNFRVDLSEISEYRYILTKEPEADICTQFTRMQSTGLGIVTMIIE